MEDKPFNQDEIVKKSLDILSKELVQVTDSLTQVNNTLKALKNSVDTQSKQPRYSRRARFDFYAVPLVTLIGVALSVGVASYWNDIQDERTRLYKEINALTLEIKDRLVKRDALMDAMTDVRAIRNMGQKECSNGKYAGKDALAYEKEFFSTSFALVNAGYKLTGIFSNPVKNKIIEFTSLVDVDQNPICGKNSPNDNTLRLAQAEVNNAILQDIKNIEAQKTILINRITQKQ